MEKNQLNFLMLLKEDYIKRNNMSFFRVMFQGYDFIEDNSNKISSLIMNIEQNFITEDILLIYKIIKKTKWLFESEHIFIGEFENKFIWLDKEYLFFGCFGQKLQNICFSILGDIFFNKSLPEIRKIFFDLYNIDFDIYKQEYINFCNKNNYSLDDISEDIDGFLEILNEKKEEVFEHYFFNLKA